MPKVCYVPRKFQAKSMEIIELATDICDSYSGLALTLRQLYYQFIARAFFANSQQSYDRLGSIINDARLAGAFDWDNLVDRTRNLEKLPSWGSPAALIADAAEQYLTDIWAPQKRRVEVWIEKDAAIGVVEAVCNRNNVPFFSCRGYTSQTEMWGAAERIGAYLRNGEQTTILHIGDHDPSGLDMTRDIQDRLRLFISRDWAIEFMGAGQHTRGSIRADMIDVMRSQGCDIDSHELPWQVKRIALTYDQVEQYNPPPNYAKESDSRFAKYHEETGLLESWELDALEPTVMEELIQDEIDAVRNEEEFAKAEFAQERDRAVLREVSSNWETIASVHEKAALKGRATP
jgi:hypothetical protein